VFGTGIDPHWHRFPGSTESNAFVKQDSFTISCKHELVEVFVLGKKRLHHLPTNAETLVTGMNQHVRKVGNQVSV
jgi:hypothetical protein